jgi:ATP/maltotriose-dependent transcriptional regulator MalT
VNPLVNISKITPPTLPKILPRPRLQNLLEKHKDKKLILILGQAAQGKTTLVASYVKTSKTLSAWITLEKEDSHPFPLFYSIVKSLQQVLKEIDFSHLLSLPLRPMEGRAEIPLFREWICSLFGLISSPIRIILDGLDRLSSNAPAFNFLQILVEDAPQNIHWVLLSREVPSPPLEFQHLRIGQEAFLLTDEELAFTSNEIGEFFRKIRGISFDAGQLRKIYSATEGWVGGLILLAESLDGFPEPRRGKFISDELPPRFERKVFQYFAKEIFSSQPERVQKFLIKSSMIDLIEPDFMRDFTGAEDAEEILQGLVRRNLFVHSIYAEEKKWLFHYHQLFRDFLKVRFKSAIKEEERQSLFLKAGHLCEKRGEIENALKYFLEAKAYAQAGSVIGQLGMNLLQSGRKEDLSQWILAFPEEFTHQLHKK